MGRYGGSATPGTPGSQQVLDEHGNVVVSRNVYVSTVKRTVNGQVSFTERVHYSKIFTHLVVLSSRAIAAEFNRISRFIDLMNSQNSSKMSYQCFIILPWI